MDKMTLKGTHAPKPPATILSSIENAYLLSDISSQKKKKTFYSQPNFYSWRLSIFLGCVYFDHLAIRLANFCCCCRLILTRRGSKNNATICWVINK